MDEEAAVATKGSVVEDADMPSAPPEVDDPEDAKAGESFTKLREELFRASVVNTFIEIDWDGEWYLATVREYLQGSDRSVSPAPIGGGGGSGAGVAPASFREGPHHSVLYGTGEEEQMLLRSDGTAAGGQDGTDTVSSRHLYS